jgi:catechol-2,3-dioxygenase
VTTLDPRVDIGHVHLKVADLERALGFWRDVLGSRSRRATATRRSSSRRATTTTTSG